MVPQASVIALVLAVLFAATSFPAHATGDRDALSDETIGLMIEDSGPGQAEALLGVLYLRGMRIESDPIAASAWLDRAARAGHPAGIYGAARMHADGIGVPVDTERARHLLRDADPARFGPLADAVRRLRHDLGLPEVAAGAPAPETVGESATPPPVPAAATAAAPPPEVPVATAEPAVQAEPSAPRGEPASQADPAPQADSAPQADPTAAAAATEATPQPTATASTAMEPPASPAVPAAEAVAGPFAQLATLFSEASTSSEMARIRGIVPVTLLQGRDLSVRPVRLGDGRTAWRIVATGFTNRDEVRIFCGLVTASGLGCLPRQ